MDRGFVAAIVDDVAHTVVFWAGAALTVAFLLGMGAGYLAWHQPVPEVPVSPPGVEITQSRSATHTVQQGDTLYRIANDYHTTVAEIRRLNPGLPSDSKLQIGTILRME